MLSHSQITWAANHDWFICDNGNGTVDVLDRWSQLHKDGTVTHHEERKTFGAFKALRDFAGY